MKEYTLFGKLIHYSAYILSSKYRKDAKELKQRRDRISILETADIRSFSDKENIELILRIH